MRQHFPGCEAFGQTRGAIVFVVVIETEKNEVFGPVVGRIVIYMRDLALAFVAVSSERETKTTTPKRLFQNRCRRPLRQRTTRLGLHPARIVLSVGHRGNYRQPSGWTQAG